MNAEVFIPAMIDGVARGNSIRSNRAVGGRPKSMAEFWNDGSMPVIPVWVFRMIVNRL